MTTDNVDDPYRRPTMDAGTEQSGDVPAARTPGILEMLLILVASTIVGGITFLATCIGTLIPIGFVSEFLSAALRERPEVPVLSAVMLFVIFLGSTAVSGYVAYRTGRAIYRRFSESKTKSKS